MLIVGVCIDQVSIFFIAHDTIGQCFLGFKFIGLTHNHSLCNAQGQSPSLVSMYTFELKLALPADSEMSRIQP